MISNILKKLCARVRGFTLIETLIAVLLLSVAVTGPLTIASKGLTATLTAKDQFVAYYLAQDAMEQVRYLRDSACLAAGVQPSGCPSGTWLSNLSACKSVDGSTACYLDSLAVDPAVATACSGSCPLMKYDPSTKIFRYTSGTATPQQFIRSVYVKNDPATPDEAAVTVTVSWVDVAGVTHRPATVRGNIFRWQ
ncbi:hypothetical protein A3D70_00345 [Candidatus Adlerbacteria bacterium RIFCSPHIGHO2_02_FULL_54_18]|uniref:Type II secretion system protein GspI C-terminal domain-containing protein n=2 Tax=Candidatus Adleribacteriota TaxID=1752736 RepID=A0A1F4Y261_9BACT|nr:MAG: hypothetical protein A2949_00255 [Candidatus Adlerbacteria bacterium RIFCSPLOWO2_01_FULL_54_21b]OGC88060.1 MAG: hypothetical protein A3D70_00345 [Candidatus Adlerbacteria bacterium RIFCSPHIGHO2_02_FULL_54_18]